MKRVAAALALGVLFACGPEPKPATTSSGPPLLLRPAASPQERRAAACEKHDLAAPATFAAHADTAIPAGVVASVAVTGASSPEKAKSVVGLKPGDTFDLHKAQQTIRRLYALGGVDDVQLAAHSTPQGLALQFVLHPRPQLGEVVVHGDAGMNDADLGKALHVAAGRPYNPIDLVSGKAALLSDLRSKGYLDATLDMGSVEGAPGEMDVCASLKEGPRVTIDKVAFTGLTNLKEDDLRALVDTEGGKVNAPGMVIDQDRLDRATVQIQALMYDRGMLVSEVHQKVERSGDKESIVFDVKEGPIFKVSHYGVKGDLLAGKAAYQKLLTGKPKEVFSRKKVMEDIARIQKLHHDKGRDDMQVVPETQLDSDKGTVAVTLDVTDPKKPPKPAEAKDAKGAKDAKKPAGKKPAGHAPPKTR